MLESHYQISYMKDLQDKPPGKDVKVGAGRLQRNRGGKGGSEQFWGTPLSMNGVARQLTGDLIS